MRMLRVTVKDASLKSDHEMMTSLTTVHVHINSWMPDEKYQYPIMNVSFIENNPLNTVIVDSSNGQPLYEVTTPWKLASRTTTIRRLKPGIAPSEGEVIAEVRSAWGSRTITLYGSTMHVNDWLRKEKLFSSCVAPRQSKIAA
jgi:Family of unknown function (DUF6593)